MDELDARANVGAPEIGVPETEPLNRDQPRFESRWMLRASLPILAALAVLGCGSEPTPYEPIMMPRFTDLIGMAEDQGLVENKKKIGVGTWVLSGDSRALLAQHPPSRMALGPIPAGESCVLNFAMGIRKQAQRKSDGVGYRVTVKRGDGTEKIFDEYLNPRLEEHRGWVDRSVPIPGTESGEFSLIFEVSIGKTRYYDQSGWAAPHVVCNAMSSQPNTSKRPNVVLISIDTLRPDHLGFYGYDRPTSPNLDALAEESLVFDHAFAPAPHTLPSHASMFTGLYPHEHGAGHRYPEAPLPEKIQTLAEALSDEGYQTIGFSAGGMMSQRYGLSQGFDEWTERQPANLKSVMPAVFDALGRAGSDPLFLFLHTYDVHGPFEQPEEYRYFKAAEGAPRIPSQDWVKLLTSKAHKYHKLGRFQGLPDVLASYDSGIRFVDIQLARLFEQLRSRGAFDNTLLIVTSDHGETILDHGRYIGHAYTLDEGVVRIPLLVKFPFSRKAGRHDGLVQLVDIVPMVLDEVDIEPEAELADSPLERNKGREWVQGEASHTGARYLRTERWKIISETTDAWDKRKKIFGQEADRFETGWQIFDLEQDPEGSKNLFEENKSYPSDVRKLISTLGSFEVPGQKIGQEEAPQGEHADALRALGYIQ